MELSYQKEVTPAGAPVDPKGQDEKPRDQSGRFSSENRQKAFDAAADAWRAKLDKDRAVDADLRGRMEPPSEQAPDAKAKADAPEQATESKAEDAVDKDAVAAALTAAKRLKIPAKVLDSMSPSELADAGRDWKKQVDESAKLSRELGEMRKQIEATKTAKAESVQADQPADVDELVKPSVASFDDETRNSLTGMSKVIVSKLRTEIAERDKRLADLDSKLQRLERHTEAESVRGEMTGVYPALGKANVWSAALKRADSLVTLPDYDGNYTDALRDAIKIECPSPTSAEQVSTSDSGKRHAATANVRAPRPAQPTKEDQLRASYLKAVGQTPR